MAQCKTWSGAVPRISCTFFQSTARIAPLRSASVILLLFKKVAPLLLKYFRLSISNFVGAVNANFPFQTVVLIMVMVKDHRHRESNRDLRHGETGTTDAMDKLHSIWYHYQQRSCSARTRLLRIQQLEGQLLCKTNPHVRKNF